MAGKDGARIRNEVIPDINIRIIALELKEEDNTMLIDYGFPQVEKDNKDIIEDVLREKNVTKNADILSQNLAPITRRKWNLYKSVLAS